MNRLALGLLVVLAPAPALGADWPQFRGPSGSGVADDQKPPVKFGPKENLAWKVAVPPGASSPVVIGDKLILTAFENNKLFTICYACADGKELWRADAKATKIEPFHPTEGSPAASTPVSDGKTVVSYFGSCGLIAYSLEGKELWRYDMPTAVTNNEFGSGTSPVLADGLVLLARDLSKDSAVFAIDLATGSQKWKAERKYQSAYSTPLVWTDSGKRVLVVPGMTTLIGYDLLSGKELWAINRMAAVACTTPVAYKDTLVYAGWSPGGADFKLPTFDEILKQAGDEKLGYLTKEGAQKTAFGNFFDNNDPNKDGKITPEEWAINMKVLASGENRAVALKPGGKGELAWTYTKHLPYVPSPIVYRDKFYLLKDGPLLTCLDAKTGKPVYEAERIKAGARYYASPVAANGHLYVASLDGTVAVVAADETEPEVVHAVKLPEPVRATPAIAHNTLYVRSDKFLYAFAAKK
ncbi:outer membrane biogenesis protein BamB [Gemmata obscuriglobus]|uniref:Pyrrolo-quinoline quinone n=1 Tax=Gemmata obscuriglobus TaxID=114 RepID=A0A2Z3H7Q9_9BACT|nr:PQQ-binding-like beta-propeller repeat protein [Gemmata obscuriglobus]AWM40871.1 pyrrolo-quinoline quinone [Gemmata obscuriglobus]QEG25837.1 outer membrane biogenesis protein BamB [Gemmata obscuriglobus]VTR99789.1 pyrrolo-quinoline quinone : Pyrrolo-quinoline quinone OS=Chthoniobacter flavus Ellin428 GN=CfE428DRAFT_1721 PE=4 SV=1: PQQ_2: PQQ_2 [Gemmata obscuriglobus UQM 2246]